MTTTTGPNIDLLRQTMDEILAHPELHRQSWFATRTECGTALCFAGWACLLSGETITLEPGQELRTYTDDGNSIGVRATDLLGLDVDTAGHLFEGETTTADLKHYVDEIAEHGRIREAVR